jgi:GT2 family glycosyltransferase
MPDSKDFVSIILVNYNTKTLAKECIDSIEQHTHNINYEIILVDNASTDGSQEMFEEDDRVTLIKSEENLGFGRANNLGMKNAKGDYFFLLNTDTRLLNNAVKYFLDYEKTCSQPSVLGGWLIGSDGNPTLSYGDFPTFSSLIGMAARVYTDHLPGRKPAYCPHQEDSHTTPKEVDFICGADMFLPRSIYEETGGFDPDFFMYYEEAEWQYRMGRRNIPRILLPEPRIIHYEGGGKKVDCCLDNKLRHLSMTYASMFTYMRKTSSFPKYMLFRILFCTLRLLPILLRKDNWRNKRRYLSLLFR